MFPNILPSSLQYLLSFWLWTKAAPPSPHSMTFELRHFHGLLPNSSHVVFADASGQDLLSEPYTLKTKATRIPRARFQPEFFAARFRPGLERELLWDETDTIGPDVQDRKTLQLLARMTANAYALPGSKDWYDLPGEWNTVRLLRRLNYLTLMFHRATPSAGSQMRTVSEGTSSRQRTTPPSLSP